jgi:hypothetical protein
MSAFSEPHDTDVTTEREKGSKEQRKQKSLAI